MFKVILITASIALVAFGRPQAPPATASAAAAPSAHSGNASAATFLKNDRTPLDDKGSYKYDIELSDGTKLMQEGNTEAPSAGDNETSIVIKGSYSYISPEGTPVNVMYIANKDGYQPTGDVIPKASSAPSSAGSAAPAPSVSTVTAAAPPSVPAGGTPPVAQGQAQFF